MATARLVELFGSLVGAVVHVICSLSRSIQGVCRVPLIRSASHPPSPTTALTTPPSIHNVPKEIIIAIFKFYLLDPMQDSTLGAVFRAPFMTVANVSRIVTLSHVCSRWRAIALGYPPFWTHADGHNTEQLGAFLKRSGTLPVSLFVTTRTKGYVEVLSSLGRRIERLDLTVCRDSEVDNPDLGDLSFINSGALKCFTLNYEDFSDGFRHHSDFLLFGERILPLQALFIFPLAAGPLPANRFPHLTHLYLAFTVTWDPDTGMANPMSSSIFDFLSNAPNLEFVSIYGIQPMDESVGTNRPVCLEHLRSLVMMGGDFQATSEFLERISIPVNAFIHLQGLDVSTPDVPHLSPLIVTQSIDRLSLATEFVCLQLIAEGPSSGLWLHSLMQEMASDEDEDEDTWCRGPWLSDLPTLLPLANITSVDLYVGIHHDILLRLLPHITGVVEFSIRLRPQGEQLGGGRDGSLALKLYRAFSQANPLLCPKLRTLNIDVGGNHGKAAPDLYPIELRDMLTIRSRAGCPVHHVVLQPFADEDVVDWPLYDSVAERFDTLADDVDVVLRGPGISTVPYVHGEWERWDIRGAEKYWQRD